MTKASEEPKPYLNIYQRLHAAMKDVSYVKKEDKKVNNQYSFVGHDAVTALTREALHKQDVIYILQDMVIEQDGNRTEVRANVVFICIEKPEDRIAIPAFGYGIDTQDKGPGKAISYLVKYALLKTLALETGDDPEKDSIEHKPGDKKFVTYDKTHNPAVDNTFKMAFGHITNCVDEESTLQVARAQYKILKDSGATQQQLDMITDQKDNHVEYLRNKHGQL